MDQEQYCRTKMNLVHVKMLFLTGFEMQKCAFLQGPELLRSYLLPSCFQPANNFLFGWVVFPLLVSFSASEGLDPISRVTQIKFHAKRSLLK